MKDTQLSYFTAIEEHFQGARGTRFFQFSPRDWAFIDALKNGGIPLEAVLRGIDIAFEKWHLRPAQARTQMINSLAYCAGAIMAEAQAMANATSTVLRDTAAPFPIHEVRSFIARNAAALRGEGLDEIAVALEGLDLDTLYNDLEKLERCLNSMEDEMIGYVRAAVSEDGLIEAQAALDQELRPYRSRMTADQLAMLERQFLERRLLAAAGLPRLSLFYV